MYGKNRFNHFMNNGFPGQMSYGRPIYSYTNSDSRNQLNPYMSPVANFDWIPPYQHQNQYYQPQHQFYGVPYQPGVISQQMPYPMAQNTTKDAQFLFQNPLQPQEQIQTNQYMHQMNGYPIMNPYPRPNAMLKQPGGIQSFMNSFKSQDGTVDVNKMVNTTGQLVNAVTQVSSLVKGLGGIFKA